MTQRLTASKSKAKSSKVVKQIAPSVFHNEAGKIVYLGCRMSETEHYLKGISNYYRCREMTVREPNYTTGFDRFLRQNKWVFNEKSLDGFLCELINTAQLKAEHAGQLWDYLEASYK